jgi:hypothetical protein
MRRPRRWEKEFSVLDDQSLFECVSTVLVSGGHDCIVALRGCFDAAAQGRIDETLVQILCLFPASKLICPRVSSFVGFLDILGEEFGKFGPQRGWNSRTFPEHGETFLDREVLSASVGTFQLQPIGVLAETSVFRPERLDEFLRSLKQYRLLGNGTYSIECEGG